MKYHKDVILRLIEVSLDLRPIRSVTKLKSKVFSLERLSFCFPSTWPGDRVKCGKRRVGGGKSNEG